MDPEDPHSHPPEPLPRQNIGQRTGHEPPVPRAGEREDSVLQLKDAIWKSASDNHLQLDTPLLFFSVFSVFIPGADFSKALFPGNVAAA